MSREEVAAALRAGAKGLYPTEAAVELLIRHGRAPLESVPWVRFGEDDEYDESRAFLDVEAMLEGTRGYSSSERRVIELVACLYEPGRTVALEDAVSGLDRENMSLVLAALAHANGSHEHPGIVLDEDGEFVGFEEPESLYPWPKQG